MLLVRTLVLQCCSLSATKQTSENISEPKDVAVHKLNRIKCKKQSSCQTRRLRLPALLVIPFAFRLFERLDETQLLPRHFHLNPLACHLV